MCATSDPASRWHAVSFTGPDGRSGVELRAVFGTERETKTLEFQGSDNLHDRCREIAFTPDGKWLALLSSNNLRLWDTEQWMSQELRPGKAGEILKGFAYEGSSLAVQIGPIPGALKVDRYRLEFDSSTARLSRIDAPAHLFYSGLCGQPSSKTLSLANQTWQRRLPAPVYPWFLDRQCASRQWFARIGCRDNMNFAAQDCDIQFVPIDHALLLRRYESLTWTPPIAELDAYVSAAK